MRALSNVGKRALDDVIPELLANVAEKVRKRCPRTVWCALNVRACWLQSASQARFALDGLRQILSVRSHVVLPYLVRALGACAGLTCSHALLCLSCRSCSRRR